ncbi:hypothetical protein ACFFRR_000468 [Megaselia abdita]
MLARIYLTLLAAVVFEMEAINSLSSSTNATNIIQTSAIPPLSTIISRTTNATKAYDKTASTIPSLFPSLSLTAASSSLSPLEPSVKSQMNQIQNEIYHRSPLYTPVTLLGQYRNHNKDKIEDTSSLSSGSSSSSTDGAGSEYIHNLEDWQIQQEKLRLAQQKNVSSLETNVTVQIGNHAYLPCNLRRFMNKPVSWVRLSDEHILTVDQTTFIADQRFESLYRPERDYAWSMQIKYIKKEDEGWYECQVSSEPKISTRVYLKIVVPQTEVIGDHIRFVKTGSKVAMHCIVKGSLEPPVYIIWSHNNEQILPENTLGWFMQIDREIFGNSSDQQNTIGSLIIPSVKKLDSGNYTCSPSNSASVTVDLHVLSGEYSASAIMSSGEINKQNYINLLLFLIVVLYYKT